MDGPHDTLGNTIRSCIKIVLGKLSSYEAKNCKVLTLTIRNSDTAARVGNNTTYPIMATRQFLVFLHKPTGLPVVQVSGCIVYLPA